MSDLETYKNRIQKEIDIFNDNIDVHNLPNIFHYWSKKYIKPIFEEYGFSSFAEFFAFNILKNYEKFDKTTRNFISIGAGNCNLEVEIVKLLLEKGLTNFKFECVDINEAMLERGRALARHLKIEEYMTFTSLDCNQWVSNKKYTVVIANQSLHHIEKLETLFSEIKSSLVDNGKFIINDMIGRNGHQRWPEALTRVRQFWSQLPDRYKYNHLLGRTEVEYVNWDCSGEGFEGIRAQDILPLLIKNFHFEIFIAYGNIIDIFIDRCFGHNFDVENDQDIKFIDMIHETDEALLQAGAIKPTHLVAVLSKEKCANPIYSRGLTPENCVREVPSNIFSLFIEEFKDRKAGSDKLTAIYNQGVYEDLWVSKKALIKIKSLNKGTIRFCGYFPENIHSQFHIKVQTNEGLKKEVKITENYFEFEITATPLADNFIELKSNFIIENPGSDTRELSFLLVDIKCE